MPDHQISFQSPNFVLGKSDVVFVVSIDGEKQGELHISEGGIDWWPKSARKKRSKSWTQLRAFMES